MNETHPMKAFQTWLSAVDKLLQDNNYCSLNDVGYIMDLQPLWLSGETSGDAYLELQAEIYKAGLLEEETGYYNRRLVALRGLVGVCKRILLRLDLEAQERGADAVFVNGANRDDLRSAIEAVEEYL